MYRMLGALPVRRRLSSRDDPPWPPGLRLYTRLAAVLHDCLSAAFAAASGLVRVGGKSERAAVMTPKPNPQRGALQSKENAMKRRDFLKAAGVGAAASVATSKAVAQSQLASRDQFDIDSHDKIWQVVDLAMKGAAEGDLAKLREAFHRDARMFGEVYGKRYDAPI